MNTPPLGGNGWRSPCISVSVDACAGLPWGDCAFRHVCRKRMVLAAPRQRKTFPGDASEVGCCPASPARRFPAPFLDNVSRYAFGACRRGPGPHARARPLPVFPVRGDAPGAFPAVPATAHIFRTRGHHENLPFPAARPDGGPDLCHDVPRRSAGQLQGPFRHA